MTGPVHPIEARIPRLDWTRPLQPLEPAQGFASRIASLNGRTMPSFLRDMRMQPRDIDLGALEAVERLARIGRCDPAMLMAATPRRPADKAFMCVGDETLSRTSIHRTFFRFCPHCLAEDVAAFDGPPASRPWLRLAGIVGHVRSCDAHGTMLLRASPIRARFEPFDFNAQVARMLPDLDRLRREAVAAPRSEAQAWLLARLAGCRSPTNWLDGLPLYVALDLAEALGISASHPPKVKIMSLTEADLADALEIGFAIGREGEPAIRDLFGELAAKQADTRGYWGLHDTFGYAWKRLAATLVSPAYEPAREIARAFALESVPIEPGTDVLGHRLQRKKLHTVRSASLASGTHSRTIRRFLERKGHAAPRKSGGVRDHRVVVSADEVEAVIAELKNALTTPKAIELLCIPREHFLKAVSAGHIETVLKTNAVENAKHRFTRDAVEDFRARLFAGAIEVARTGPRQMNVIDTRRVATAAVDDLLAWTLDGSLKWKGRITERSDYHALLLDADEIIERVRSSGDRRANLTREEVWQTAIPGMQQKAVPKLIAAGHLTLATEFSPDARRKIEVVTRKSVEVFLRDYVCLGELCQRLGLHHKQVRQILRGESIETCLDEEKLGVFVYERAVVDQAIGGLRGQPST